MTDEFKSSWSCWVNAKDHIVDLHRRAQAFFKTKPYDLISEADPNGPGKRHKIKFFNPLPDKLPSVIFDAVSNLRASLDQAAFVLAKASSNIPNPKDTHFPFGRDSSDFEGRFKGKSKDLPEEIRPLLRLFQPYKGGNDLLWALNRIRNANQHSMLAPITFLPVDIQAQITTTKGLWTFYGPNWDRRNQEIILVSGGPNSKLKGNINLTLDIAFDEVEIVGGQPAVAVLRNLANMLGNILLAIELEAIRLGIIP